jgi:non-canonical (house-cleaning) NTP pyrophosphatase
MSGDLSLLDSNACIPKARGVLSFRDRLANDSLNRKMRKVFVAVGSTRRPKLNAVRDALAAIGPRLEASAEFELVPLDVPSGVGHTPLSRQKTMEGARGRVEEMVRIAQRSNESWNYFVGLEGGLDILSLQNRRIVFLENWAYVSDGGDGGAYGQSGAVSMPEPLARRVVDDGIELSQAMDEFVGGEGIRDSHGAWGALTCNLITRQDAFRVAIVNAFAPFFNKELYRTF